jgi:hypothetical protein
VKIILSNKLDLFWKTTLDSWGKKCYTILPTLQQLDVFWEQLSTGGRFEMLGHSPVGMVTEVEKEVCCCWLLLLLGCWRLPLEGG